MMLMCSEGKVYPVMQHLVSVSVIGSHDDMTDEALSSAVHQEMSQWFGDEQTADWKLLKVYRISFAQPNQVTIHSLLSLHLSNDMYLAKSTSRPGSQKYNNSVRKEQQQQITSDDSG